MGMTSSTGSQGGKPHPQKVSGPGSTVSPSAGSGLAASGHHRLSGVAFHLEWWRFLLTRGAKGSAQRAQALRRRCRPLILLCHSPTVWHRDNITEALQSSFPHL